MELARRAIPLPLDVASRRLRRGVHRVAAALAADAPEQARARAAALTSTASAAAAAGLVEDALRARALVRLLTDLYEGGWDFHLDGGRLFALAPPSGHGVSLQQEDLNRLKARARRAMMSRVRERVSTAGAARLIREVEDSAKPGVTALMADGGRLAADLRARGPGIVRPYLEPARGGDGVCEYSGVRRHAAFRYFRYLWSFPASDAPGRSIPFLIRDAGQRGHPVCGLLCLASPVLRLAVRDEGLGLGTAWLQAVFAALDVPECGPGESLRRHLHQHLTRVIESVRRLRAGGAAAPVPERLVADVAEAVGAPEVDDPRALAWHLSSGGRDAARARLAGARRALAMDLITEVRRTIDLIDAADLDVDSTRLRQDPDGARTVLLRAGQEARERLAEARAAEVTARRADEPAEVVRELRVRGHEALFEKKRAVQLASALGTLQSLSDLAAVVESGADEEVARSLRSHLGEGVIDAGASASQGIGQAMLMRKVRLAASQVAEVSLCGAVPPYRDLLGGKLAALLALSREAAQAWYETFDGQVSEIQSKLAGREVKRPASLLALSTTSLYAAGSSQYNRARLPAGLGGHGWRRVGLTAGHGTLHFSQETSSLLDELVTQSAGERRVTGRFGEGPSERLRKLRDGLKLLDLPSVELLNHGMPRIAYVAPVAGGPQPGARRVVPVPHHEGGPTTDDIAAYWRERWLGKRINSAGRLDRLEREPPPLLSRVFSAELSAVRQSEDECEE